MTCIYDIVKCPECKREAKIEERQQQVHCAFCGIYFDRYSKVVEYDKIKNSTTPLYDGLMKLNNLTNQTTLEIN